MKARDELADILMSDAAILASAPDRDYALAEADAVLAAGYRKPRTITTTEELDALPNGAVIINALGEAFLANKDDRHGVRVRLWHYGGSGAFRSDRIDVPATVLHEPEGQA